MMSIAPSATTALLAGRRLWLRNGMILLRLFRMVLTYRESAEICNIISRRRKRDRPCFPRFRFEPVAAKPAGNLIKAPLISPRSQACSQELNLPFHLLRRENFFDQDELCD